MFEDGIGDVEGRTLNRRVSSSKVGFPAEESASEAFDGNGDRPNQDKMDSTDGRLMNSKSIYKSEARRDYKIFVMMVIQNTVSAL